MHADLFNIASATDTYKDGHWALLPENTRAMWSYFQNRPGAKFREAVFFGLQPLLYELEKGITRQDVDRAEEESIAIHGYDLFNRKRWDYIVDKYDGKLPIRISAIDEGTVVPVDNVLFAVENLDEECFWLVGVVESFLTHVWHASLVATISREARKIIRSFMNISSDAGEAAIDFMYHDFGYRSATSHESAMFAGAAHLVSFKGSDTKPALRFLMHYYDAPLVGTMMSVAASEHSTATALGRAGERKQTQHMIDVVPGDKIFSNVSDSFDIMRNVNEVVGHFKPQLLRRDGKYVVRPDSLTEDFPTKPAMNLEIINRLWAGFGGEKNTKGFKVLNPHIGIIDGDANNLVTLEENLGTLVHEGYSAENLVHGAGGSVHQTDLDRDKQRSAFKCAARQTHDGVWHQVKKETPGKVSKGGRQHVVMLEGGLVSVPEHQFADRENQLKVVFDGVEGVVRRHSFEDIRSRAAVA